jgi:redox-sensing transcriptional repressor
VASDELAAAAGVNSAKLRKDLSHLGSYGTRGVGYDVDYLVYQVSRELGLTQDWPVLIVGAGNLGRALANYGGFASRGFHVAALVDSDPAVVGTVIARHTVRSAADIEGIIERFDVAIGVIATPAPVAQNVCDRLVAAGVTSILNFAPIVLNVPSGVDVRKVDLSIELQILAFHAQRRGAAVGRPGDLSMDGRLAGRRIDGAPRRAGAPRTIAARGTTSGAPVGDLVAGRDGVPGEDLGLSIAAELNVRGGTRGVVPPAEHGGGTRASYDPADDDFETGAQAVGT